jgi:hypothetical protein
MARVSSPIRDAIVLLASGVVCAGCYGRNHTLHDGTYVFAPAEILVDQCGGIQSSSSVLWSGAMRISGDYVRLQMDDRLYGIEAIGYYLSNEERFSVDGSAGSVIAQVGGAQCLVALVHAHLESTTDSATAFHGAAQISFTTDQTGCFCQSQATYTANLQ